MRRIGLFLLTNIAILVVLSVVARFLGLESILDESGVGLDLSQLLGFCAVFGMGGAFISLAISKWQAKHMLGVRLIESPRDANLLWLVERVSQHAKAAGIGMPEVGIYEDATPNAFATGASRNRALVAVSSGLLQRMNRDELDGVLGHEIGHVTARHGVRQHSSSKIAEFIGKALLRKTDDQAVTALSNLLGGAILRGYGRKHELEADRLGAEYLARSGYEPRDMIGVVGILKDQEEFEKQRAREERRQPRIYHGVFSTHPDNDRRLQEVIAAADRFRGTAAAARDDAAFIRRLDGMAFGERQSGRRIRVVQVRPGERIADLARVSNLERHAEAQLRLLNGLYPDGEPRPGQWIKIVQ